MDEMTQIEEAPAARPAPRKALLLVAGIMIAVAAAAVGIYLSGREKPAPIAEEYVRKLGIEAPETRVTAPDFSLKDLSGATVSLKDLKGKAIFINFWATWCVPCRQEMPTMEKLHREYKQAGLEVVAINFRETEPEVRKFVEELGLTFTILLDTDGKVSQEYGVWSLPLSYFVNRKGEVVGKVIGYRNWHGPEAQSFFRELLKETA